MFRAILNKILRNQTSSRTGHRQHARFRPSLEELEGRWLLAARLQWVGPQTGTGDWSGEKMWQWLEVPGDVRGPLVGDLVTLDNTLRRRADLELRFAPAANKDSRNDIPGLSIAKLQVESGFTQSIKLATDLTVRGGYFRSGTIKGPGTFTIDTVSASGFSWEAPGGTSASPPTFQACTTVLKRGQLNIIGTSAVAQTVTLKNATLQIDQFTVASFTAGALNLLGSSFVQLAGQMTTENSTSNLSITSPVADVTTTGFDVFGTGTLSVTMASTRVLDVAVPFSNSSLVNVESGTLTLGATSVSTGQYNLGGLFSSGTVNFSVRPDLTTDVNHNWKRTDLFRGNGSVSLESRFTALSNRVDANAVLSPSTPVVLPSTIDLVTSGGAIKGQPASGTGQGGTLKVQSTQTTLAGTILWGGALLEVARGSHVTINKHTTSGGVFTPSLQSKAKLLVQGSAILSSGSGNLYMGDGTEIAVVGTPTTWNDPIAAQDGVFTLAGSGNILSLPPLPGRPKITLSSGAVLSKPPGSGDSIIGADIDLLFVDPKSKVVWEGATLRHGNTLYGIPRKGRAGPMKLEGSINSQPETSPPSLTIPQGASAVGMSVIDVAFTTNGGEIIPGDVSQVGVISFLGGLEQTGTGHMRFDLGSGTPGYGHDQVEVEGSLTRGGFLDIALLTSFTAAVNDEFVLIDNSPSTSVSGSFSNHPDDSSFVLGGWIFHVDYNGGDSGNDVVLTVTGRPGVWGHVFTDVNGNGLRDSADTALDDVTVTLLDITLQFLDSVVAADGGYYSFDGLDEDTYTVAVAAPTGTFFTTQNVGSDDDFDSDVDATGHSTPFIINANTFLYAFDAGLYQKGNLSGLVWTDANGDGLRDAGEAVRSFVAVQLLDAASNVVAATSTAADGSYSFADVVPGEYALRINDATLSLSPANVGIDDTLDSDFDPTERTAPVLLLSGESFGHLDAGVFVPVTVQGKTWIDSDGDGVQGLLELSLADVPVTLFRADGVPLDDTTTNAFGSFTFSDVAPGSYYLVVDTPNASQPYYFTGQNQGGNDALDSDVNTFGITATFALTSGQSAATFDAGLFQLGSVGGMIWDESDADGVRDGGESGRAATAVDLLNAQGNIVDSTATYSNGSYAFNGLVPGSYSVRYAQGAALMLAPQNVGGDDTIDSDAHPGTRLAAVTVLSATELTSVDAGVYDPLSVGGTAWIDSDGDGLLENGEPALAGVGVALLDELTQTTLASTTTAANGTYVFNNLPAGNYLIAFTAPAGHTFTVQGGDSDADPTTGRTATFALTPNQTAPQLDARLHQPGSISGVVWEDSDGDGVRESGELLRAFITVSLLDAGGNFLVATSTATDGSYQFGNLTPGSYTVRLEVWAGRSASLRLKRKDGWTRAGPPESTPVAHTGAGGRGPGRCRPVRGRPGAPGLASRRRTGPRNDTAALRARRREGGRGGRPAVPGLRDTLVRLPAFGEAVRQGPQQLRAAPCACWPHRSAAP